MRGAVGIVVDGLVRGLVPLLKPQRAAGCWD